MGATYTHNNNNNSTRVCASRKWVDTSWWKKNEINTPSSTRPLIGLQTKWKCRRREHNRFVSVERGEKDREVVYTTYAFSFLLSDKYFSLMPAGTALSIARHALPTMSARLVSRRVVFLRIFSRFNNLSGALKTEAVRKPVYFFLVFSTPSALPIPSSPDKRVTAIIYYYYHYYYYCIRTDGRPRWSSFS